VVGEVICGRYQLEELLGSGGMSSVYRAHDTLLERDVALKILHEHHAEDEEYVERFRREARAVAQLSHPNIVTVIDRGEDEGRQFIVFEYVEGRTLKDLVDEGPLDVRQALEVTIKIARGLGFAHEHGIVHRDVKPQNVLLNDEGEAKVTDFGIARSLDLDKMTQSGTVLGTSNYIAPEQATGKEVDVRTDVYSLGVVLFELLCGEVPFVGESFVAVAMRHVHEPAPSVLECRNDLPPRVVLAVEHALEKDPADRFASMKELADELEACLRELGGETADTADTADTATFVAPPVARRRPPAAGRRRAWVSYAFAGAAALLLAAALVGILVAREEGPPVVPPAGGEGTESVRLSGAGSFDPPPGDGREHDERVGDATDGDANTYWTTERYSSFSKPGVGLVLDAGRPVRVSRLTIVTDTPGFTALVRSGASPEEARAVSAPRTVSETTEFDVSSGEARYYVIWITNLGSNRSVHVNEVKAA
jgi:eukaryotic-like serine/threonine-protein kinase